MSQVAGPSSLTWKVGRYDVVGYLAAGGMAEILLGRILGPSGFQRPVVIKRILPHLAREKAFVAMFLDEARIIAGIRHPNVVQVHELGHEGGELFLVMEYLEGESLAGLARRLRANNEALDYALAAYVIAEACAGLHAAHELTAPDGRVQNVVHRDVSPQNILVTYAGQVKVLDFGVAVAADRVTRTETGTFKGKLEYGSPEQCRGKPLDRRSDVFALGILLFELSTGTRLFKRTDQLETLRAICERPVVPPTKLVPGYPEVLSSIIMRALEKDPAARYPTAQAMRHDLLAAVRTLTEEVAPEDRLGAIMRRLFAHRVEEKAEMLRRVQAGSSIEELPAVETDSSIEIPIATDQMPAIVTSTAPLGAVPGAAAAAPEPRRSPWPLVAVGAAALAGVAAFVVVGLWVTAKPPDAGAATASGPPAPAPPLASSPAPSLATSSVAASASAASAGEVVLRVETVPPKARVFVAGDDKGLSPVDVRVPRGAATLALTIRRDGYKTLEEQVVPETDQKLRLTLTPSGAAQAKPAGTTGGYHRFD